MGTRAVSVILGAAMAAGSLVMTDAAPASHSQGPRRGRIVFAANVDGDYELFVMRADATRRRRLTHNDADDLDPAWAPGGKRIAFVRQRPNGVDGIFILNLRSGKSRPWLMTRDAMEGEPEWSPNGKWIAFRGGDFGDGSDVLAMRVDRSDRRVISYQSENSSNVDPTWSPDGKRVALVERHEDSDIYLARFCCEDAPEKRQVTPSDRYWEFDLDWSPGGDCILYARYDRSSSGVDRSSSLHALPVGGGSPREVYSDDGNAEDGSWSPDGRRIVFSSDRAGTYDLYIAAADGTNASRITASGANEITPAWFGRVREPQPSRCAELPEEPEPLLTPS